MPDTAHDLLVDPILSGRADGRTDQFTLPGVLAAMSTSERFEFVGLQPHQSHGWYAFLVQIASMAMHRNRATAPPHDSSLWAAWLLGLSGGRSEPWCLLVEDPSLPAFMQPPAPDLERYKPAGFAAGRIDILVTSKNHDVKQQRCASATPEHWVFALTTLQTMEGYSGSKNHGIARMNGGMSNRSCVALVPSLETPARFRRDVELILVERDMICRDYGFAPHDGKTLLWMEAWNGSSSLSLSDCDPLFVEICRRIRLCRERDRICARSSPTAKPRIAAKERKGDVGDPWLPIRTRDGAALTVGPAGFGYRLVRDLLLSAGGEFRPSLAMRLPPSGDDWLLYMWALARGQGETAGLHERVVRVPARVRQRLFVARERDELSTMSRRRIELAAEAQRKILKPVLCALLQGGPESIDFRDPGADAFLRHHDARVDACFFSELWNDVDLRPEEADLHWKRVLMDHSRQVLEQAISSAPLPSSRRDRAIARAEGLLHGLARKKWPDLFEAGAEAAA